MRSQASDIRVYNAGVHGAQQVRRPAWEHESSPRCEFRRSTHSTSVCTRHFTGTTVTVAGTVNNCVKSSANRIDTAVDNAALARERQLSLGCCLSIERVCGARHFATNLWNPAPDFWWKIYCEFVWQRQVHQCMCLPSNPAQLRKRLPPHLPTAFVVWAGPSHTVL